MGVYEDLGLQPIINASGAVTRLGGAPMPEAVQQAWRDAAAATVSIEQLQAAASARIAAVTGAEAGLVTSGAAAAMMLGTAAILAGNDPARMERLPHCDGFPHEMVIAREQRSGYDHAVRAEGARLVEVGFHEIVANAGVRRAEAWEYRAAIGPNTAGIVYVYSPTSCPPLEEVVACAHAAGLSVLVDAAGELPPRENLRSLIAAGADLVAFSGGKAIRGPQSSGILCGRSDLIASAAAQMLDMDDHPELWNPPSKLINRDLLGGMPRHGIGRALKVGKEEIVALLKALELFASGAYAEDDARTRARLERIASAIKSPAARCAIRETRGGAGAPLLEIALDEKSLGRTAFEVCRRLRAGTPAVYVGHGRLPEGILIINPTCVREEQVEGLCRRLNEELNS